MISIYIVSIVFTLQVQSRGIAAFFCLSPYARGLREHSRRSLEKKNQTNIDETAKHTLEV